MSWLADTLDQLAAQRTWSYRATDPPAVEPTALAALALQAHGRHEAAVRARAWLAESQAADGSLGVSSAEPTPHWTTPLAMLAWQQAAEPLWQTPLDRASEFLLSTAGKPAPRSEEVGHDTTLVGWAWVEGTHSWVEPTAMSLLALRATGQGEHVRAREAVRLLVDRLLPTGGCNSGNTEVLGNYLMPHLEPSGLVLAALAGEREATDDVRLGRSVAYVAQAIRRQATAMSLAYGLIGLAAWDQWPDDAPALLATAATNTRQWRWPLWRLALLAIAERGTTGPWMLSPTEATSPTTRVP